MILQRVEEKNMSVLSPVVSCGQGHEGMCAGQEKKVGGGGRRRRRRRRASGEGGEAKKRRLSEEQAMFLEKSFWNERKLETGRKVHLATEAGLEPKQVAVWFQNRRARWKSKQLQLEYTKLKSMHDNSVVEKSHLQAEVLKLKQQLLEAEREKRNLSSRLNSPSCGVGDGGSGEPSSSPCSSAYTMETNTLHADQLLGPTVEELGIMDGYNADPVNMFDWFSFC